MATILPGLSGPSHGTELLSECRHLSVTRRCGRHQAEQLSSRQDGKARLEKPRSRLDHGLVASRALNSQSAFSICETICRNSFSIPLGRAKAQRPCLRTFPDRRLLPPPRRCCPSTPGRTHGWDHTPRRDPGHAEGATLTHTTFPGEPRPGLRPGGLLSQTLWRWHRTQAV